MSQHPVLQYYRSERANLGGQGGPIIDGVQKDAAATGKEVDGFVALFAARHFTPCLPHQPPPVGANFVRPCCVFVAVVRLLLLFLLLLRPPPSPTLSTGISPSCCGNYLGCCSAVGIVPVEPRAR
jgi:hypothetical protein